MPSTLTPDDVRRIAALARLELTSAEIELFAGQLTAILEYAADLQRVDTSGVPPAGHAFAPQRPESLRADEPAPSLPRASVLEGAPAADASAGFFTVPRVIGS